MSSPPRERGPPPPPLPAWKRAILERKRAKLAAGVEPPGAPAVAAEAEKEEEKPGKEPSGAAAAAEEEEPRVVAESLGPLRENPFMRLESERRRRRRRRVFLPSPPRAPPERTAAPTPPPPPPAPSPSAASSPETPSPPLSQLLELYSSMPGIRTIRADHILIIESRAETETATDGAARRPEPPRQAGTSGPGSPARLQHRHQQQQQHRQPLHQPWPPSSSSSSPRRAARDPFRALVARAGSPVTEIRAAEVVLYEPSPEGGSPAPEPQPGRVSRLLQKFDRRPRGGGGGDRTRWRGGDAHPHPPHPPRPEPAVPNACPDDGPSTAAPPLRQEPLGRLPPGGTPFVQKVGTNSFTVNPRGHHRPRAAASEPRLSNGPVEAQEDPLPAPLGDRTPRLAATPKPVPSPSAATAASSPARANSWKPKPEGAAEIPPPSAPSSSASPVSSATASAPRATPLSTTTTLSSTGSFEIRPASKPDLASIPPHDLQAQALASLRLNSRNSFLFVPCRKGPGLGPPEPSESLLDLPEEVRPAGPRKPVETLVPVTDIDEDLEELDAGHFPPLKVLSPRLEGFVPQEGSLALEMDDAALPLYKPHPAGLTPLSQKGNNTFTVVPKRKPLAAGLETFNRAWPLEDEEEEEEDDESRARARIGAPHQELGRLLKKRYPTVNEIEVIGGYLSLDKSCMSKAGSGRKKMKISFNESRLQTMFEYPSESSLVEEEEEEEEEDEYATEVDEPSAAVLIPRPNSPAVHSNVANSAGLSSYTPKHSLEFSRWQEQQLEGMPPRPGVFLRDADPQSNPVMLTPADQSSLSDFSSEPALYF